MLQPYPDYQAAGSPWLGFVPIHWIVSRFGYEAVLNGGQVDPRDEPWLNMTLVAPNHIESGTGRLVGRESAAKQGADSGKYIVKAGQIMYSKIRPALNKAAVAVEDGLCSADMYSMSFRQRVDPVYALYQMLARPFHHFASVTSGRVKMPKVNREELSNAPWLVPPLREQRLIAGYLDLEAAQIDALIGKQERLIGTLSERRATVVDNLVLPGASSVEPDATQTWGGHRAVGPALAALPKGWRTVRFKAALERVEYRNERGDMKMMSLKSSGEVVSRSLLGERQEPDPSSIPRYLAVRPGNLVVNPMWLIGGAVGVSGVLGAVSPDYRVFRSRGLHHPRYLHHLLRSRPYRQQYVLYTRANTTFDRRVQQPDLDNLPLPVPPIAEQAIIAQEIDKQTARIDALVTKAERFIALAKERRSALITAAVTGQIDVREHDPLVKEAELA